MKKSNTKTQLVSNFYNAYLRNQCLSQSEMKSKKKEPKIKIAYESYDNYLKRKFEISFHEVRDIVNKFDPFDLMGFGMPEDEYESEVGDILLDILNANYKEELLYIVKHQFGNNFNNPIKVEKKCNNLAEALYEWKNSKTSFLD